MKENGLFPAGSVPIYIDGNGRQYNQQMAILIMLAKEHGFYSSDPDACYINDWAVETMSDIITPPDFLPKFF